MAALLVCSQLPASNPSTWSKSASNSPAKDHAQEFVQAPLPLQRTLSHLGKHLTYMPVCPPVSYVKLSTPPPAWDSSTPFKPHCPTEPKRLAKKSHSRNAVQQG